MTPIDDLVEQIGRLTLAQRQQLEQMALTPSAFRLTYRNDPAAFVQDCFTWPAGEGPQPYQDDASRALVARRRVSMRAPHGVGKTTWASWIVLWFALVHEAAGEEWKIVTTAGAWRQLLKYLWPEIHKWTRRLRWEVLGRAPFDPRTELHMLSLKLAHGEAFAVASDLPDMIEGAHAANLLYVLDEAKAIPAGTFDAVEGALMTGNAYVLSISTPGSPTGRFYEIQARKPGYEDWWTRHVTYAEGVVAFERSHGTMGIDPAKAAQRARQWGTASSVYQNRVLGEFAADDEAAVIPLAWVELANERWRAWHEAGAVAGRLTTIGVDVARSGEALTVLATRAGDVITGLRRFTRQDTMATVGQVSALLSAHGGKAIVDVIGIGAGVFDRLRELRCDVHAFNAAERTEAKDRSGEMGYVNLRSAAWWMLREQLDPANDSTLALPPDDMLTGDLTAPTWRVASGGKIAIEEKDEIRKRLGRSTDDGDAVVMAFADRLVTPDRVAAAAVSAWGAATEEFTRASYWTGR